MPRMLSNWLTAYMEYTDNTESAKVFHAWTARSVISAVLRKKVKLELGRINVYPNTYIVLVSEPGIARKSQAITFGYDLLANVVDVRVVADAITREALIDVMSRDPFVDTLPDGTTMQSACATVFSKEFETFLGQKQDNARMVVFLTDMFDATEMPWKYVTIARSEQTVPSVYLSLLGATTPESLACSLPVQAIGGGLTSRILFVYANAKAKKVAKPVHTPETLRLKEALINDLHIISRISGTYQMSPECDEMWEKWYMEYDEQAPSRICHDASFAGWYSRKPLYLQKMALIHAASQSNALEITWEHFEAAIKDVEEVERSMSKAFSAIGRSAITADVERVLSILRARKKISGLQLRALVYRDMDNETFTKVITTASMAGLIRVARETVQGSGTPVVMYYITQEGARR